MADDLKKLFDAQSLGDGNILIEDSIVLARKALHRNPTKEERRKLEREILHLTERSAAINAKIIAVRRGEEGIEMPSEAQIMDIAKLAAEVEALSAQAQAASHTISLAAKVLDLVATLAA